MAPLCGYVEPVYGLRCCMPNTPGHVHKALIEDVIRVTKGQEFDLTGRARTIAAATEACKGLPEGHDCHRSTTCCRCLATIPDRMHLLADCKTHLDEARRRAREAP